MLNKLSSDLIKVALQEFKREEKKIQENVLNPVIKYCINSVYPYIMALIILFTIMIIFTFAMLIYLIVFLNKISVNIQPKYT